MLIPGTGATPAENWSWTYQPALDKLGIPWCTLELPEHNTADIADNAQYVTHAIRVMHAAAGRKISLIGHSQGGMLPRTALRWWPDTRAMVDDVIGFAASNHGTLQAVATCTQSCDKAAWQQRADSQFIAALNSPQETFPGISYTNVYTRTDEIVTPSQDDTGSSSLHGGGGAIENVAIQEVCALNVFEHYTIGTVDNTAYMLAIDALNHDGPAVPSRIDPLSCLTLLMPGINLLTFAQDAVTALAAVATFQGTPVGAEPPLRCWMLAAGCGGSTAAPPQPAAKRKRPKKAKCRKPRARAKGKRKAKAKSAAKKRKCKRRKARKR
jgi:hypothetical protein